MRYLIPVHGLMVLHAWYLTPHAAQAAFLGAGRAFDALGYPVSVNLSGEALDHLAGAAFGLLAMTLLAAWANSQQRLVTVGLAISLVGTAVSIIGMAGTSPENLSINHAKFFSLAIPDAIPTLRLPLPGLGRDGWVNPNALGATALMVMPFSIAIAYLPHASAWAITLRVFGTLATIFAAVVIVLVQSRSVWLAALVVAGLAASRKRPVAMAWSFGIAGMILGIFLYCTLASGSMWDRTIAPVVESVSDRMFIWHVAVNVWFESPWFGIGLNQFHVVESHQPWPLVVAHAHNEVVQMLLDIGLFGTAVYVAMQVVLFKMAIRASHSPSAIPSTFATAAGLSLVGVHLFGLGDAVALGAKVGAVQWLASGIILSSWALHKIASTEHAR